MNRYGKAGEGRLVAGLLSRCDAAMMSSFACILNGTVLCRIPTAAVVRSASALRFAAVRHALDRK